MWIVPAFAALAAFVSCFLLPSGMFLWNAVSDVIFFAQKQTLPWTSALTVLLLLFGTIALAIAESRSP
jgi:hypothetical protein